MYERKVKENERYVGFLGCEFSNFFKCQFELKGLKFDSSEKAFMYSKAMLFGDKEIAEQILKSKSPKECKRLGRKVRGFDEKLWNENKEKYMRIILFKKFSSDKRLKNMLLSTGNKIIVECAPFDREWGIGIDVDELFEGKKWKGKNKLGYLLMEIRDIIKED
ncbi:NADAR family protein [Staphylococcus aureus]|uniref:NADAR family protein n=1 Tax=Staphylococcus aureus TaxID=1280 RepID=UPI0027F62879|nr:NADAR family protein [Staphylococcus aureus]MDQ7134598.1 NADAR family protein [Staphylococcus aureus]